jgi:hypothetical protein
MKAVNRQHRQRGHERRAHKRVRDAAMMREAVHRAAQVRDDVNIRHFCRQHQRERRQRRLAIQPRARNHRAGQEVSNWLHSDYRNII